MCRGGFEGPQRTSGRLSRQVQELTRKNSDLTLSQENLNIVVKKLKGEKTNLEAKIRNLEEDAENTARDKDQCEKLQKSVKDLRVSRFIFFLPHENRHGLFSIGRITFPF